MKILIADDEIEAMDLFRMMLRKVPDSQIDMVVNGEAAVEAFRQSNPDIIIMDVNMPVKSGYQASMEIAELCRQNNLRLPLTIFCSGSEMTEEIKTLVADKSRYVYFVKPVSRETLIKTITETHK